MHKYRVLEPLTLTSEAVKLSEDQLRRRRDFVTEAKDKDDKPIKGYHQATKSIMFKAGEEVTLFNECSKAQRRQLESLDAKPEKAKAAKDKE